MLTHSNYENSAFTKKDLKKNQICFLPFLLVVYASIYHNEKVTNHFYYNLQSIYLLSFHVPTLESLAYDCGETVLSLI